MSVDKTSTSKQSKQERPDKVIGRFTSDMVVKLLNDR